MSSDKLPAKIFADAADLDAIASLAARPEISGFTTNPTLMRKAGVTDYEAFSRRALEIVGGRPISFEVFSDDHDDMFRQALKIASWGDEVYVKIPITNTKGLSSAPLLRRLVAEGVKTNVTAIMTLDQVRDVVSIVGAGSAAYISVFAGRIADTGRDPLPIMAEAVALLEPYPNVELIWASPREVLNLVHASQVGCHIITMTNDLLAKLPLFGKDLVEFSIETVKMFRSDALSAGFEL
jgi:transaldolase